MWRIVAGGAVISAWPAANPGGPQTPGSRDVLGNFRHLTRGFRDSFAGVPGLGRRRIIYRLLIFVNLNWKFVTIWLKHVAY